MWQDLESPRRYTLAVPVKGFKRGREAHSACGQHCLIGWGPRLNTSGEKERSEPQAPSLSGPLPQTLQYIESLHIELPTPPCHAHHDRLYSCILKLWHPHIIPSLLKLPLVRYFVTRRKVIQRLLLVWAIAQPVGSLQAIPRNGGRERQPSNQANTNRHQMTSFQNVLPGLLPEKPSSFQDISWGLLPSGVCTLKLHPCLRRCDSPILSHQRAGVCWFLRRNSSTFSEDLQVSFSHPSKTTRSDSQFRVIYFGKQGEWIAEMHLVESKPREKYPFSVSLSLPHLCLLGIKQVSQAPDFSLKDSFKRIMNPTDSWGWEDVWTNCRQGEITL